MYGAAPRRLSPSPGVALTPVRESSHGHSGERALSDKSSFTAVAMTSNAWPMKSSKNGMAFLLRKEDSLWGKASQNFPRQHLFNKPRLSGTLFRQTFKLVQPS